DAWIRMHYVYPYPHVDNVIPLMAEGKILPYLDIPFQHASPNVLKAMKRPASSENNLQRIKGWRNICPDITIRSTFIVGFPGETEDDFSELLDFINDAELDRVGCFTYSPVEGAVANEINQQIPEDIKQERLERFMTLQAEISANKLSKKIGQTLQVIVDEVDEEGVIARSMADAPEIDGMVFIDNCQSYEPGTFINVRITDSNEHDLFAEEI
ncbi:MAG: radical SAM protein, partial [Gammaproteobacteria bacterium]|nr:radical SAM protein [Gammaproteobacteria bacterium]